MVSFLRFVGSTIVSDGGVVGGSAPRSELEGSLEAKAMAVPDALAKRSRGNTNE